MPGAVLRAPTFDVELRELQEHHARLRLDWVGQEFPAMDC